MAPPSFFSHNPYDPKLQITTPKVFPIPHELNEGSVALRSNGSTSHPGIIDNLITIQNSDRARTLQLRTDIEVLASQMELLRQNTSWEDLQTRITNLETQRNEDLKIIHLQARKIVDLNVRLLDSDANYLKLAARTTQMERSLSALAARLANIELLISILQNHKATLTEEHNTRLQALLSRMSQLENNLSLVLQSKV